MPRPAKAAFRVTGAETIHCAACEQAIQRALRRTPGVRSATADHRTQQVQVQVRLNPATATPDTVQGVLSRLGYEVVTEQPKRNWLARNR